MKTTKRLATLLICLSVGAATMAQNSDKRIRYDKESDLEGIEMEPQLLSMHENYDPMDHGTWPVFSTPCVAAVAPKSDDLVERTALWCTKKATYMFTIREHWLNRVSTTTATEFIRDSKTGKKYYIKEHKGAPVGVSYKVKGNEGKYIYSVSIYPPLPKNCTHIDIGEDVEPEKVPNVTNWVKTPTIKNIPVRQLQANQYKITGRKNNP